MFTLAFYKQTKGSKHEVMQTDWTVWAIVILHHQDPRGEIKIRWLTALTPAQMNRTNRSNAPESILTESNWLGLKALLNWCITLCCHFFFLTPLLQTYFSSICILHHKA